MDNFKRIAALVAVIAIVLCALLTLLFALLGMENAWKASAYAMVVVPVLVYVMLWIGKVLEGRGNK